MVWDNRYRPSSLVIPDFVIRGFKTESETCILIPHYELGMMCGSSFHAMQGVAGAVYRSPDNPAFPAYDYHNWIASPYFVAPGKLFALAHSEWYQCLQHSTDPTKRCSTGSNQVNSWSNAITAFFSSDSGRSWSRQATLQRPEKISDTFVPLWPQSMIHHGFFEPGNIIKEGDYYYSFVTYVGRDMNTAVVSKCGLMLMRTKDLFAKQWEQVIPGGMSVIDPYNGNVIPGTCSWNIPTVTYNTSLCKYLMTFTGTSTGKIQYTTFDSLANPQFGPVRDLENQQYIAIPENDQAVGFNKMNYPTTQIDPDSKGYNFEYTDDAFYMLFSSFRQANGMSRNVYRMDVALVDAMELANSQAQQNRKGVIGNIDGIFPELGTQTLKGWTCDHTFAKSIPVNLYVAGPSGYGGVYVTAGMANLETEPGVSTLCATNGVKHRFSIDLTSLMRQPAYVGKPLYVYGFSTTTGAATLINRSGQFVVPGR
ncbi:hypothetical protein EBR21_04400 [bacterium]|nr:hypothetical protein [bacterium]